MKKILLILAMAAGISDSFAQDTIQIDLNEKAKVTVTAQDRESLRKLKSVDFNKLIKGAIKKVDTTFVAEKEEKEGTTFILFGNDFIIEGDRVKVQSRNDTVDRPIRKSFVLDIGLNDYLDPSGNYMSERNMPYGLKAPNSVYVGIGKHFTFRIGGKKSPVSLRTGLMLDWYNFKFRSQNYLKLDSSGTSVAFGNYNDDFGKKINKSKLVVSYLHIPLMMDFKISVSQKTKLNIGIGGYAGIKVGGRTKINLENEKIKERNDYYLNSWRYGLEANFGVNDWLIFCKYDLNPLFQETKGPKLHPISIGVRL